MYKGIRYHKINEKMHLLGNKICVYDGKSGYYYAIVLRI